MLGKGHFYKIVLFLVKTITHKFWTCKNDRAILYTIDTFCPPPTPPQVIPEDAHQVLLYYSSD